MTGGPRAQLTGSLENRWPLLEERTTQPLDQAADRLAVQCQRVDDTAHILHDETVKQPDIARPRVDCDMRQAPDNP